MGKRRNNKAASARGGYGSLRDMLREDEKARGKGASGKGGKGACGAVWKNGATGHGEAGPKRVAADAPVRPAVPLAGDPRKRIAIIGGGAAGLAAAVEAGRTLREAGCAGASQVVVFEADERVGRFILATGNGRCNFSNQHIDGSVYRNGGYVDGALASLHQAEGGVRQDDVHGFFRSLGMEWREEAEGRLYPVTGKASTVVDVLRAAMERFSVVEACRRRAERIDFPDGEGGLFHIRFDDGSVEHAAAVILAVGGKHAVQGRRDTQAGEREGCAALLPERYAAEPLRPVLGPLAVREGIVRQLDNIRIRARVRLADDAPFGKTKAVEQGEVLFRSYGVSGICIFNLSRFAEPGDALFIDFLPQVDDVECRRFLSERLRRLSALDGADDEMSGEAFLRGLLLPPVARVVLKQAGIEPDRLVGMGDIPALEEALKAFSLTVAGIGDERQCQVLRGGLSVDDFDAETMESLYDPGLFAAGEALDVDAPCGGYNLHWAWASGLLAGISAACRIAEQRA